MKINTNKAIATSEIGNLNITTPSMLTKTENKYGFFIPRLAYYTLPHTWILNTIVVKKQISIYIY